MADDVESDLAEVKPTIVSLLTSAAKEVLPKLYDDAISPGAKQVGKAVETVGMVGNMVLMPIRALAMGWDKLEPIIAEGITERLKGRDPSTISAPPCNIVIPALQGYAISEEAVELREMFLNLIATSMTEEGRNVHPSFADIIRQLSPDEARILQLYGPETQLTAWTFGANKEWETSEPEPPDEPSYGPYSTITEKVECAFPARLQVYFDNLLRLRLVIESSDGNHEANDEEEFREHFFEAGGTEHELENLIHFSPEGSHLVSSSKYLQAGVSLWKHVYVLSDFGEEFFEACVRAQ